MKKHSFFLFSLFAFLSLSCSTKPKQNQQKSADKTHVIFDTDANNELDDQHALAYLLFNGNTFAVDGITVNATYNGGDIEQQFAEAERVVKLCGLEGKIPLIKGADKGFAQIKEQSNAATFDGSDAVNFIIKKAKGATAEKVVLLAVGKLTNVALALKKDPSITQRIRVVWLGSNYPEPGEYNQDNDTIAMNYVLNTEVDFEMVTVRYGKPSGTDAIRVTKEEINKRMPGKGPKISTPVKGRHELAFNTFGDYSVNLFEHITYHGDPPARALFDMAAVAIVKNPSWATAKQIPCPILINNQWVERPENRRKITIWENFDRDKIMKDFYQTMDHYILAAE
jgi:inosine-uridine nucleoside N-ribohydrolase